MDKKNVISLVLGLIIGALVIWLVMSFTDAGSTMVLRYSNNTKPAATITPTKTPSISGNFDFTMKDVNSATLTGKKGEKYFYTANMSGNFYEQDGATTAKVTNIVITDLSTDLEKKLKSGAEVAGADSLSVAKSGLADVTGSQEAANSIETFVGTAPSKAKEAAAMTATTNTMLNLDGNDQTALTNNEKTYSTTSAVGDRFKSEFNADNWEFANKASYSLSPNLENKVITDAGWFGDDWGGKKAVGFIKKAAKAFWEWFW